MSTSVHPRACGEHKVGGIYRIDDIGSSPRVRGTQRAHDNPAHHCRFIPARAGNTVLYRKSCPCLSVHPRACGEHGGAFAIIELERRFIPARAGNTPWGEAGSSPRVRGTHEPNAPHPNRRRFIPARAGNTSTPRQCPARKTVHPRACGEHRQGQAGLDMRNGSSPRVRGTLADHVANSARKRFIPARAGNTVRPIGGCGITAVHPRACGEHHHSCSQVGPQWRFIPARAGNTTQIGPKWPTPPVHPRACGEHKSGVVQVASPRGSSPRVRGTRIAQERPPAIFRFIPARAGNTFRPSVVMTSETVHPRACGEHLSSLVFGVGGVGSSPRVRGTRFTRHIDSAGRRFIPARAGNTTCWSAS